MLLTAVFRRLRQDDQRAAPPEDDFAFKRRMSEIEERFGKDQSRRRDVDSEDSADPKSS